jgi:cyclohexyl-isocyanide hydratase
MSLSLQFGFLLFPNLTQLDLTGPAEVFGFLPNANVHLIWKNREPVATSKGWCIVPTTTFADCPQLDVICVPGGSGQIALMNDEETLDFLRKQAEHARYAASVCTGSLVLGAAGLLKGYRAACHWMALEQLALLGAIPVAERVVKDRNRITGGGVTAGIDFGLAVVAELCGEDVAKAIQLRMEYNPQPPFRAGSPTEAGPAIVERVMQATADRDAKRLEATRAAADRLRYRAPE